MRPQIDRYVIDVAAVLRDEGSIARTLSDVLISRVPGLLVVPGSGLNGAGARIRFAGVRSLVSDFPPLIFLDGMRIDAHEDDSELLAGAPGPSRLDDIPIEDVQSIEVLDGPASAAIYGLGAAGGTILIRSKRAQSGRVRVEGLVQGGMRDMPSNWPANYGGVDLDKGRCSLKTQAAGQCVQDFVQSFNPLVDRNPFTNAPYRSAGLNATGGNEFGAFRIAGNIDGDGAALDVPAVTWANDMKNSTLRASGTAHPLRILDVEASAARISHSLRLPMYGSVLGALLGPSDSTGFTWDSVFPGNSGTQKLARNMVSLSVQVRPLRWLQLGGQLGYDDLKHDESQAIATPPSFGPASRVGARSAHNHTFAFHATVPNLHWLGMGLTTTIGIERLTNRESADLSVVSTGGTSGQFTQWRMNSTGLYATEQVGIGDRLFVTGALRHNHVDHIDALSGTSPSLAVDWIARPERRGALGGVVLHAGYGSAVEPPPLLLELALPLQPLPPAGTPIAPIKPDRTREFELSAEASGFGSKWRARLSLYDLRSYASKYEPASQSSGYTVTRTDGTIANRGLTAMLSGRLIDRDALGWDVRVSVWGNRNRLVQQSGSGFAYGAIGGGGGPWTSQRETVGFPVNAYRSRPLLGYSDANGDGIITTDEIILSPSWDAWAGTPYPTQGVMVTSSWHIAGLLHVAATLDYRAGQTLLNQTAQLRCEYELCREANDPTTPLAAQATATAAMNYPLAYFEEADYLKLRELSVSVDLPERLASTFGARGGAVTLGGRDLVTWTKYSGGDPETASYGRQSLGSPMIIGDYGTVPVQPLWMLRVRLVY